MRITIEVEDKLGENIKRFCKLNNLTYTEYLSRIIEEKFNIDRFGDLNEKVSKNKPVLIPVVHNEDKENTKQETTTVINSEENKITEVNEVTESIKKKRQLKIK